MKTFTPGQTVEIRLPRCKEWIAATYEGSSVLMPSWHSVIIGDVLGRVHDARIREASSADDRRAIAERILLADLEDDDISARIESGAVRNKDGSITLTARVTIPADRIDATIRAAREGEAS